MIEKRFVGEDGQEVSYYVSGGNVFGDFGERDPEDLARRAYLAREVRHELERRGLKQRAAAQILGLSQPEVSELMNGRISRFSGDRLFRLAASLGLRVTIAVERPAAPATP